MNLPAWSIAIDVVRLLFAYRSKAERCLGQTSNEFSGMSGLSCVDTGLIEAL